MEKKVLEFAKKHSLFNQKKILVAVSGGVDSMALLHFFLFAREKENLQIAAIHYEHGIRGEESKKDAAFVEDWCKDNNIPCFMGAGNVPKFAKDKKITVEMAARELRYKFFDETLKKERYDAIATAHHADDQAETALLNIMRGAGVKGLVAMRPKRDKIIRPFLSVEKSEILEYAKIHNIPFREDSTNKSLEYRRNRIRHELLPLLESYQSGVKNHLTNLAEIARFESDYLDEVAKGKQNLLLKENLEAFKKEPLAIQRRIILVFLEQNNIFSDFTHVEEIRKLLLKSSLGKRIEINKNVYTELSYKGLRAVKNINQQINPITLKIPGENILREFNIKITTMILDKIPLKTFPDEYYADYDKIRGEVGVRGRIDGDVIDLAFGKKSIKKIFMEEKIERSRRNIYPIIFCMDNILWIPKLRRSVFGKATKNTKRVLYMKVEEI